MARSHVIGPPAARLSYAVVTPVHDEAGTLIAAVAAFYDMTELRTALHQQKLLLDEINHRVKNTLATVQSIATLTRAGSGSVEGYVEAFQQRLFALSQYQRTAKNEGAMFASLGDLFQKYPQSKWAEEGYMQAGNYYWVLLDRPKAASYYQKVLDNFPEGKNAYNAGD